MKRWFLSWLLFSLLLSFSTAQVSQESTMTKVSTRPEFRAFWVTRSAWSSSDPEKIKQNVIRIFDGMTSANFNAAIFQIRGCAETLYPSEIEPWSYLMGSKDPGFDTLKFAIDEAHKRGIQFHAYINAMPMLEARQKLPAKDLAPNHLFWTHGPESKEPWVCCDDDGKSMKPDEYYYMSPGIPAVQEYMRKVILDVVKRYDVDGIHLDRVRYPDAIYSHDSVSLSRFFGRGNPTMMEWPDWQREQLNKFINDLAAEIAAAKPKTVLSCSAWGIYNRYNIPGYETFSSGYHDYYQDTWNWVRLGAMDYLMPMIYWNIADPKPNYNELVEDFIQGVGKEHLVAGQSFYRQNSGEENIKEIQLARDSETAGTIIFSYSGRRGTEALENWKKTVYQEKVPVPAAEWKTNPQTGIIIGNVLDENNQPLPDAWVRLYSSPEIQRRNLIRTWPSGSDGRFAFLKVPNKPVTVQVEYPGFGSIQMDNISVKPGEVNEVHFVLKGAGIVKHNPFFYMIDPENNASPISTQNAAMNFLGRTNPGNSVTINGEKVPVYKTTGGFVRDNISLTIGENTVTVQATNPDGNTTEKIFIVHRQEPLPEVKKERTDFSWQEPAENLGLMPGDVLQVTLSGPTGYKGTVTVWENLTLALTEITAGTYVANYRIPPGMIKAAGRITANVEPVNGGESNQFSSKALVETWSDVQPVIVKTNTKTTGINMGLHNVRLGGPYLGIVPMGTKFEIIGQKGSMYKVKLSKSMTGWISAGNVEVLPRGTPIPHGYFTDCSMSGDSTYDTASFPVNDEVAVVAHAEIDPSNRIIIDFFNTHHAATWFTHRSSLKTIGPVSAQQMEEDWLRVTVPVNSKQIWGYWLSKSKWGVSLIVKHAPQIAKAPASPLKGLTIGVEAGHGGNNSGAMGTMGTKEKSVNSLAFKTVKKLLEEKGAKVIESRPGDSNPDLDERFQYAMDSNADFFLSIHANSSGTGRGYLKTSGTSVYYKEDPCYLPARLVYLELLKLGWNEFGTVGNFNYYPIRQPQIPAILVEQAFMSNPADEARLLDREYQAKQAAAIIKGLELFLTQAQE